MWLRLLSIDSSAVFSGDSCFGGSYFYDISGFLSPRIFLSEDYLYNWGLFSSFEDKMSRNDGYLFNYDDLSVLSEKLDDIPPNQRKEV